MKVRKSAYWTEDNHRVEARKICLCSESEEKIMFSNRQYVVTEFVFCILGASFRIIILFLWSFNQ